MKIFLPIAFILAVQRLAAADPEPFAPTPFQLEIPLPVNSTALPLGVRIDFPIGSIRIDRVSRPERNNPTFYRSNVDGPGPGYRKQRVPTAKSDRPT